MSERIRTVVAEDHGIMRAGLRALISDEPDFEVVGEAADGYQVLSVVEEVRPDLVLLDLSMPRMSGLDTIQRVRTTCPRARILVLTVHDEEEYVFKALQAGADGYALKYSTTDELLSAARRVVEGHRYLSPQIAARVIDGYLGAGPLQSLGETPDGLTPREVEIVRLVAQGNRNREIAVLLGISERTVEKHRANVMGKLGIHNASALTAYAIEKGLVKKG